jgi:surface protein
MLKLRLLLLLVWYDWLIVLPATPPQTLAGAVGVPGIDAGETGFASSTYQSSNLLFAEQEESMMSINSPEHTSADSVQLPMLENEQNHVVEAHLVEDDRQISMLGHDLQHMREEMENMRRTQEEERNAIPLAIPIEPDAGTQTGHHCCKNIIITVVVLLFAAVIIVASVAATTDDSTTTKTMSFKTRSELQQAVDKYLLAEDSSIQLWDVSAVSNFTSLFDAKQNLYATLFNGDITKWNMSNAVVLERMFAGAINLNQDLSAWNVSQVKNIDSMFEDVIAFNQDLSPWNVAKLTTMNHAFYWCQ